MDSHTRLPMHLTETGELKNTPNVSLLLHHFLALISDFMILVTQQKNMLQSSFHGTKIDPFPSDLCLQFL